MRPRVPTWVLVRVGSNPQPWKLCHMPVCPHDAGEQVGVGEAGQHSLLVCVFPHLQAEGCCPVKCSTWPVSWFLQESLHLFLQESPRCCVALGKSLHLSVPQLCSPQKGTIKGATSQHGRQDETRMSMVSSLRSSLNMGAVCL